MDLDGLKEKWLEQDRKLDETIRLNRQLLIAAKMNGVRSPLQRFFFLVSLGASIGLIILVILGRFIHAHWAEPRFALPAMVLQVWVIASLAASIRQMAMALQIDYDKPIAAIQKQIESLRVLRIRITQWALLTGQVVWWTPFLIVALKGFWYVDAYQVFGTALLSANLAVGLAIIPLAIWVSKRFGDRMGRSPVMRRLMRELAGYNMNAATDFLATLSKFENETRD
jgi:flagellar biogenesis protein FliO